MALLAGHYHVLRHRPDRQRRALPGAQEHPHRLRHRHAGDGGHAAAGGGAWASWRVTSKGWVDDVVQYLYTTLFIRAILLIAACLLLFQVYIDLNPDFF